MEIVWRQELSEANLKITRLSNRKSAGKVSPSEASTASVSRHKFRLVLAPLIDLIRKFWKDGTAEGGLQQVSILSPPSHLGEVRAGAAGRASVYPENLLSAREAQERSFSDILCEGQSKLCNLHCLKSLLREYWRCCLDFWCMCHGLLTFSSSKTEASWMWPFLKQASPAGCRVRASWCRVSFK